jgi:copper chaperone
MVRSSADVERKIMEKVTMSVPAISCGHCINSIKNELLEIDGVKVVEGDAATRQITVSFDKPATIDDIRNTLKEINYPAE